MTESAQVAMGVGDCGKVSVRFGVLPCLGANPNAEPKFALSVLVETRLQRNAALPATTPPVEMMSLRLSPLSDGPKDRVLPRLNRPGSSHIKGCDSRVASTRAGSGRQWRTSFPKPSART